MLRRTPRHGILVGLAVLAIIAVPALFTAAAAVASFTGCFIACSVPDRSVGALWAGRTLVLLVLPIAAGLVAARVHSACGWLVAVLVVVVLLACYVLLQGVL